MIAKNTGPMSKASTSPDITPLRMISIYARLKVCGPFFQLSFFHHPGEFVLTAHFALAFHPSVEGVKRKHIDDYLLQRRASLDRVIIVEDLQMLIDLGFQCLGVDVIIGA